MTAQDRTGRPESPTHPRRRPHPGVALLTGLAIVTAPVVAASWPASRAAVSQAAPAPTSPSDSAPGSVTFRVTPATPTAPPTPQPPTPEPTPQPPTPEPTPSGGHLPVTGGDQVPGWLPTLGALLVLGGGLTIVIARRSRRASPDSTGQY
ncbi:LPXTG cell wall anchor domain-containing protein [Plantactinospora soyae]|uniref:LPXTG-motif cell wall-anchored protein n=1 Tax=Plantactinospora soyae TaxID=1544732 RepID=A0A927RCD2_9ACTN|nr:LPXTG cell wall anchor domain-containing protein [Plantactinospora soyae]MBE1492541.1 LPXTG-motif cell wall-anchored protein [Plantactinospora soyae]